METIENNMDYSICIVCGKQFKRKALHQITCSRTCSLARNLEIIEIIKQKKHKEKLKKNNKYYYKNNIITKAVLHSKQKFEYKLNNKIIKEPYQFVSKKLKTAIDFQIEEFIEE